ncbi:MAG: threonine synthase [Candidatus Eremiobacteraeota bacterium]|nr:threonine synthase [Candidatus Eremiobacteraeota bacterium]
MTSAAVASRALRLVCSECGAAASPSAGAFACTACGGLLAFTLPGDETPRLDRGAFLQTLASRRASSAHVDRSGVWRFRELLPAIAAERVVTLREGDVPLYGARLGAGYAKAERVAYLHLGMNPTASFKDFGMTVAISEAHARDARVAVCASTGNTSASMAAYAARAGMVAAVLVPEGGVSEAKLAQTLDYGAHVLAIGGDFDAALEVVRGLDPQRYAIVNSLNPYRIEGQKTIALVLLEAREWNVPDWVILPGGNLGNASAIGKGFREARALGLIERIPRLAVVQAAGAAPLVRAFESGEPLVPVQAETTATAIKIGAPASWRKALGEIRASHGTVLAVSDDEIADARAVIGADGIGCEPASAASLAGFRTLRAAGAIGAHEDVVLILTGHLLKDGAYAARYHAGERAYANPIARVADARAARRRLAEL